MLKPLKQWYCDICGNVINRSGDGYVIWRQDDDGLDYDFKIIHKKKCDPGNKVYRQSLSLDTFLGEKGMQWLLGMFLSRGKIKAYLGQPSHVRVKDIGEFVDFFRRVQTPYYEEARTKFNDPNLLDYYSDNNEVAPYTEESLKEIISTY